MTKKLAKRSISSFFFAILFVFIPTVFQITHEKTMAFLYEHTERQDFFTYHKVEPEKDIFTKDEELKFISFLDVKRPLNFAWNDILRCKYDGDSNGVTTVGSMNTFAVQPVIKTGKVSAWVWSGPKPQTPALCFLESNITASVGYGVTKTQKVISDDFRIE